MGFLSQLSTVVARPNLRAADNAMQRYTQAFFSGDPLPDFWLSTLANAGVTVTPDLAMTLSAVYSAVTMISYDLATLPPHTYQARDDGGKDPVRARLGDPSSSGIHDLAYKLRWAPNSYQTSTEFFLSMLAQFLMRSRAYAEIVPGPGGFADQLLPRHPDRVLAEWLPSGRIRYKLTDPGGVRYLLQEEMFVVRDLSLGGLNDLSRVSYGAQTFGTALAAEKAAAKFFKNGMTAALLATHTGDLDEEDERDLHASISRYAAGVDNAFGLMLVPDDVKVSNLAVEPEKAQMMATREWGVREVARMFRMPPAKLGVAGTATYASAVQNALDYVIGCLRPTAVTFEQAIHRDLILDKGVYFVEFLLDALMRGDPAARAAYYQSAIQNRWMRPSEVRLIEGMNPDPALDALSESDHKPGGTSGGSSSSGTPPPAPMKGPGGRALLHAFLAVHDSATRCLRRERAAVEKLARKHASDPAGWQRGLTEFYADHAQFVGETMRLPMVQARAYAAEHASAFVIKGLTLLEGEAGPAWEREEADALAGLAMDQECAA